MFQAQNGFLKDKVTEETKCQNNEFFVLFLVLVLHFLVVLSFAFFILYVALIERQNRRIGSIAMRE
jgi:hypothetical protein